MKTTFRHTLSTACLVAAAQVAAPALANDTVKEQIERFTGYSIKGVNVYVQGVTFGEKKEHSAPEAEAAYSTFSEEA